MIRQRERLCVVLTRAGETYAEIFYSYSILEMNVIT